MAQPVIRSKDNRIKLWLEQGEDKPYLSGIVTRTDGQDVRVYGHFSETFKNAEEHGEKYPAVKLFEAVKKGEKGDVVADAWPQNERQDGKPVNFRTLIFKLAGEDKPVYATTFDNIGAAREMLGFAGEPVAKADEPEDESAPAMGMG